MAAERLSSIVSQLTPGQKPLDKMYVFLYPSLQDPSFHMMAMDTDHKNKLT